MARQIAQLVTEDRKMRARRKPNFLRGPVKRKSALGQEHFEADAIALATQLGWQGDDVTAELNLISINDARRYLQKSLHQAYVDAVNGNENPLTAEQVCRHLGIDKTAEFASDLPVVDAALKSAAAAKAE